MEAAVVLGDSPRACAALMRLVLQKLLDATDLDGDDINSKIASAVQRGVPRSVQQACDVLRVIGNNAVHPGQIDLRDDAATATALFKLVNIVAEKLFTEPREVAEMFDGLPEGAKAQIEKRDAKSRAE